MAKTTGKTTTDKTPATADKTPATGKTTTRAKGDALAERMAGLGATPAAKPARERPAPRQRPAAAADRRPARGRAMPAEQPRPPAVYSARISLTTTPEMKRALDIARAEDGTEATARIRAMISLWQDDPRLRARIDKLARTLR
jgi:hypothetical protein